MDGGCRFPRQTLFQLVVVFLLSGIFLTGCNGNGVETAKTSLPSNSSPITPDGPTVIPFFTTEADPNQIAVLKSLVTEYQSLHPNVEIDIILASPASRGRRLLTALASGADLGIFEIEPTLMTDWVDAGYLLPLDDLVDTIGADDYVDGSLFKYRDHIYALPYAISVYGLWIRTDRLAEANLPIPKNYNEVLAVAKALTHDNMYGIALPGGQNIAAVNYFSVFLWQNGGDYFTCDGEVAFNQSQALEAVQKWAELTKYAPQDFTVWGYKEQIDAFLQGRVAMAMYAGRMGVTMAKQSPEMIDNVALVFPPWGDEKVTLGVWSRFAIAAGTHHKTEARDFLQWLVSGDRLLRYDMTVPGHMIPPLYSVQRMIFQDSTPYVRQQTPWLQNFQEWVPFTNHPAMNMGSVREGVFVRSNTPPPWSDDVFSASGIIDAMLQEITMGGQTPEDAWQYAVIQLQQTVSTWKAQHPDWQPPVCNK